MSNMMYYTIYRACTKQDKGCDISGKSQPPKISAWIDIHCEIQAVPFAQLSQMAPGESSETIRARVIAARKIQD